MRLIRQYKLHFSAGGSKVKVFEADLCEVGSGRFVVNFRYGRSGHPLRDGTRTLTPTTADQAEQELEQLLNEKLRSGYEIAAQYPPLAHTAPTAPLPATAPLPTAPPATAAAVPAGRHLISPLWQERERLLEPTDTGTDAVLSWLERHQQRAAMPEGVWPLARVAWRAGTLRLPDAVPLLLALRHRSHGEDYAIAWALGRCGGLPAEVALEAWLDHPSPSVGRSARAGLSLLLQGERLGAHHQRLMAELPAPLRDGGGEGWRARLIHWVGDAREPLARLYLLGERAAARARLAALDVSTSAGVGELRTLLQLSEHADDIQTFVQVAARLEEGRLGTTPHGARRLRARCWHSLHQQHADDAPGWRALAWALLLAFNDAQHPHASDPRRRLHQELADALHLLLPTAEERQALLQAPSARVSALAAGLVLA